ncbi:hypothetical protein Tco_0526198 [Tanacetum coccineum]
MHHSFPWRYFQHDLISYLKLKGFPSYVCIALLTITGSLNTALDLNNLLSCLIDDLWASELIDSNFSPTDRYKGLKTKQKRPRGTTQRVTRGTTNHWYENVRWQVRDTQGQIKVLPPRTAEEILSRERERKARTTLLMALPEDHLAKFHKMTDAKEMWDAIKSRFGGNDESKKMQKYILKQQFKGFSVSNSEGLHKGYDRFQTLMSQLEIHGAGISTEDANQKFLRSLPSACSLNMDHEDLEPLDEIDLERNGLEMAVAMIQ